MNTWIHFWLKFYWSFHLGGYINLPAIHLPCQIPLNSASFSPIAKQRKDSIIFFLHMEILAEFRDVIKRGGSGKKTDEDLRNTVEVDVRSFWALVNFFLLAICQEIDCKSFFYLQLWKCNRIWKTFNTGCYFIKTKPFCFHIFLWYLYSDHCVVVVLFLTLIFFVCVFVYF